MGYRQGESPTYGHVVAMTQRHPWSIHLPGYYVLFMTKLHADCKSESTAGMNTENVVPLPTSLFTLIYPPWFFTRE